MSTYSHENSCNKILKAEIQQNSKAMEQKDCVHTFLTIQILESKKKLIFFV